MQKSEKEKLVARLRRAADAQRRAYSGNLYHEGIAQGLDDAAGILGKVRCEEEPQWIPCSERLPEEENKSYWICTDGGYQCECRWTNVNHLWTNLTTDWHWHIMDVPQYSKVVAWMPLPEPYKERRAENADVNT